MLVMILNSVIYKIKPFMLVKFYIENIITYLLTFCLVTFIYLVISLFIYLGIHVFITMSLTYR